MRAKMVPLALAGALLAEACSPGPKGFVTPTTTPMPTFAAPTPSGPRPPVRAQPLPEAVLPQPPAFKQLSGYPTCPIESCSAADFSPRPISPPVIPEPNTFCGRVWTEGSPAPDGTVVEAVVEDRVCDRRETASGQYRVTVVVPYCGTHTMEVRFRVNGQWVEQRASLQPLVSSWYLDLSLGQPPVVTTPGGAR